MNRKELQRISSSGQRRKVQLAEANRQAEEQARAEQIEHVKAKIKSEIKSEIKRLKAKLKVAAEAGENQHLFDIPEACEFAICDAVMDYCQKKNLDAVRNHESGSILISW